MIKDHLKFKQQDDLSVFQEDQFESVFVELEANEGHGVVLRICI